MNIEPCVRLGMRISPKISENPADSKNNRPPNVTLLTVSSSQNVILTAPQFRGPDCARRNPGNVSHGISGFRFRLRAPRFGGLKRSEACGASVGGSLYPGTVTEGNSALGQRRIIARIDRMREIFLLRPGPELAHIVIGFDDLVPELQSVFGALRPDTADIEGADHVVEVIELQRSARRVGQADCLE